MTNPFSPLGRPVLRLLALAGLATALGAAAPRGRTEVAPYLEVQQVLNADLNEGDVLTYTAVAAGIDAYTSTRRVEAQISYRYEKRISWNDDMSDADIHNGVAQLKAELVPDTLTMNAGAIATRSRSDGRAPVFGFGTADDSFLADVYGAYAGPDLSLSAGPTEVAASYRLGYVAVDDHSLAGVPVPPGSPAFDSYDGSVIHSASASIGMSPGELPFGWTVSAGYGREDTDRFEQRYEAAYVRGDIVVPVGHSLALTAGVGYEDIQSSQQDVVRGSDGVPIVRPDGNLIPDPSRPRLLAYDQSGLIWDAGVIWRPSRRTELQARAGRRYGDWTFIGSFEHQVNSRFGISASVYDAVDSYGRSLMTDLQGMPVRFRVNRNPLSPGVGGIGGCIFGQEPGTGVCLDDAFQRISASNFRNRGAYLLLSGSDGRWDYGVGASYSNRRYFIPQPLQGFRVDQVTDENITFSATASRQLGRNAGISIDSYAGWTDSGVDGVGSSFGTGVAASYYRSLFFDRLQAHAGVGLYGTDSDLLESRVATGLFGLRYTF